MDIWPGGSLRVAQKNESVASRIIKLTTPEVSEAGGDDAESWGGWCLEHQPERLPIGGDLDAQAEFEKAVELWPVDLKQRYFHGKMDKAAKSSSWSL
ncbi:hypothetical protein F5X96DRAFT_671575 [Biscogniauxia mediterranea]|nr:hypothetical protein F5X96DRAFT_671575 [Biscogniauxia mediterranea]